MQPADFIRGYINDHEGGLSVDPKDAGNWHHGKLVGSNFGVTGDVLAKFRNVPVVTAAQMAALTLDEAVKIGMTLFYQAPGFALLEWNQATASMIDFGWGAGPKQAVKLLQRLIAVADDGEIGPFTAKAYRSYLANHGIEAVAIDYGNERNDCYDKIIAAHPSDAKYRNGWRNRTASFLPGTQWWKAW